MRLTIPAAIVLAGFTAGANCAFAQTLINDASAAPRYGLFVNPVVAAGPQWDDNVLVQGNDDAPVSDLGSVVAPALSLDYLGRRGEVRLGYTGNFALYRNFTSLNSFEQAQRLSLERRISRRTTISMFESFTMSPTTEVQQLVGVPFVRIGSRIANVGADVEMIANRRTTFSVAYNFQWIQFDRDPLNRAFVGGQSNGGRLGLRRALTRRGAMTADYDIVQATIASGGTFNVQNAWLGGEYRVDERTRIFGMTGAARLVAADIPEPRVMPAWRAGLSRTFNPAGIEISYGRTFVPSYAGGGTEANDEVNVRLVAPLGRRAYLNGGVSWRRGGALIENDLPLDSLWTSATVGYAFRPWIRVETFYSGLSQRIDRPGGALDRRRLGLQLSTGAPMRIR